MGLIRILLAIAVVAAHSNSILGFTFTNGTIAVQSFFIISGFYMSLILNEKYVGVNNSYKLFITNRILRLYPTYFIVLIVAILISVISFFIDGNAYYLKPYIDTIKYISPFTLTILILMNLSMLGQDTVMFMGLNKTNGHLFFTMDYSHTDPFLYLFLFVPQAWVIGIQLMFYLIAPFIVKRRSYILVLILILSLVLRFFLYFFGYYHDPWTHRFFPFELAFFAVGGLSYKMYKYMQKIKFNEKYKQIAFFCILFYIFTFQFIPIMYEIKQWVFYLMMVFSIPFIFDLTKKSNFDKLLGDLSYPIYISHHFIVVILFSILGKNIKFEKFLGLISLVITIIISFVILKFVINPIEKIRQKRVINQKVEGQA